MKQVYGYIRVSTKEQGNGASLPEQKNAIKEFAKKNHLKIIHFYEEKKTAAKRGRPLFLEMLNNLKSGKATGVIMHKIDRSARNLHDWASVGDLIDNGINVFFAHESLNMNERGGRLSADIQAVMASDYVRNLRQETIKGIYGRLKQGLYPLKAPIGYLNNGKGKVKTVDPIQSEHIKKLFELYVSGAYNIRTLSKEMEKRGLRNSKGNKVCKNGISRIIKNPFYTGLMRVKGKLFKGIHTAIIDPRIFKQANLMIEGRKIGDGIKHHYLFSKKIRCAQCGYIMTGEKQKGNVYYRCQTKQCSTKTIREDTLEHYVENILKTISLSKEELTELKKIHMEKKGNVIDTENKIREGYQLQIDQLKKKEQRLLDMFLDEMIEKAQFEKQKETILLKLNELEEELKDIPKTKSEIFANIDTFLELCKSPLKIYQSSIQEEKREMLEIITSNLEISGRKALFSMVSPYRELTNRDVFVLSALNRDTSRIMYGQIVFTDKKTSAILPKPLKKEQLTAFYQFLYQTATTLSKINTLKKHYEISENHACSEPIV